MYRLIASLKNRIGSNENGSVGILFGLYALPMIVLMGFAVDYGRVLTVQNRIQIALDASVLAGRVGETQSEAETIAAAYFEANYNDSAALAFATFTKSSEGILVGSALADVRTPFAALASVEKISLEVTAKAKPNGAAIEAVAASIPCLHVMDQSGFDTFKLDNNDDFDAKDCEVRIRSNHNSKAMSEKDSDRVKFAKIEVKGYATIQSAYGPNTFRITKSPNTVTENAQVVGNPYLTAVSSIASSITPAACTNSNTNKTWTGNVSPGTYCGSTQFTNVTFGPGLYIIASGNGNNKNGALKFSGSINGNAGVSFFLADNKSQFVSYAGNAGSVLKAPTTGATRGLLFFESSNRGQNTSITIAASVSQSWTGLVYLPSVDMNFQGLANWTAFNVSISANRITFKNFTNMTLNPYAWTPFGASEPISIAGTDGVEGQEGWLLE